LAISTPPSIIRRINSRQDGMGGTCSIHGEMRNLHRVLVKEILRKEKHFRTKIFK
jgi:hypothetical protein